MARGLSGFQQDILDALLAERGLLPFDRLVEGFPRQARTHSLHRAVRRLKDRGRLRETTLNGRRWLAHCAPKFGESAADRELLALTK